jgi:undecaprenyl-diphosphatase
VDYGRIVEALFLGLVEGLTEFIPVSSTGHLLLLTHFMGFSTNGHTFEVLIQLGAILAILSVYAAKLTRVAARLPSDPSARSFVIGVLIAFLPAAVIGALAHGFIKSVLFETPALVCTALIVGGIALLWIDRRPIQPRYTDAMAYPWKLCLAIGFCQVLAMIPGVSRSGSTIGGALLMGCDKRSAAEFSFFLAMPTMAGAFAYDLYKNRDVITFDDVTVIVAGFIAAFIAGVFVVRSLLDFVSRRGFAPFAWWRILVGTVGLLALALVG